VFIKPFSLKTIQHDNCLKHQEADQSWTDTLTPDYQFQYNLDTWKDHSMHCVKKIIFSNMDTVQNNILVTCDADFYRSQTYFGVSSRRIPQLRPVNTHQWYSTNNSWKPLVSLPIPATARWFSLLFLNWRYTKCDWDPRGKCLALSEFCTLHASHRPTNTPTVSLQWRCVVSLNLYRKYDHWFQVCKVQLICSRTDAQRHTYKRMHSLQQEADCELSSDQTMLKVWWDLSW